MAAAGYRQCHQELKITVVPFEHTLTQPAVSQYEKRRDKSWSLTDCLSFVVMQEMKIGAALTADHHFQQAGLRALLLEDPPS
jgi:predicted nucleic acid-binding protein